MSDQINDNPATSEGHKARRGAGFWALWGGVGAVALIAASGGAGWIFLNKVDLGGFVARRATAALGRTVQVGSLHVTPGRWLKVEIANARLANIPGGTGPDMVRVGRLAAEVKASSLLHGPMLVRHVAISDVYVMVERTPQRLPNWRFGRLRPEQSQRPPIRQPGRMTGAVTPRRLMLPLRRVRSFTAPPMARNSARR